MGVPSAIITNIDEVEDKEVNKEKLCDIWSEALESNTNIEEDIFEGLKDEKPKEEEVNMTCG